MPPPEPSIPTCFPPSITAGTTFKIDRGLSDWPNTSWKYTLILAGAAVVSKDASADPDNGNLYHLVMTASDTQPLNPSGGATLYYKYTERMTALDLSGEVFDIGEGVIAVAPNFAIAQPGDALSNNERMLAAIQQLLAGRVTSDLSSYAIAGRSLTKMTLKELQEAEGIYLTRVYKERNPGTFSTPVDVQFPPTDFPMRGRC
jgi:hypothetical protein